MRNGSPKAQLSCLSSDFAGLTIHFPGLASLLRHINLLCSNAFYKEIMDS